MSNVCEEKTFERIFLDLSQSVRDYLYYMSGDMALSEDLVQDIFFKLWQKCKDVPLGKARAFLFAVAKNQFLSLIVFLLGVCLILQAHLLLFDMGEKLIFSYCK
ncbi:MAG: sigma factor [Bacteroidota bacterium]